MLAAAQFCRLHRPTALLTIIRVRRDNHQCTIKVKTSTKYNTRLCRPSYIYLGPKHRLYAGRVDAPLWDSLNIRKVFLLSYIFAANKKNYLLIINVVVRWWQSAACSKLQKAAGVLRTQKWFLASDRHTEVSVRQMYAQYIRFSDTRHRPGTQQPLYRVAQLKWGQLKLTYLLVTLFW